MLAHDYSFSYFETSKILFQNYALIVALVKMDGFQSEIQLLFYQASVLARKAKAKENF